MLGPLVTPGSRFLELVIVVDAWSFNSLRLPDAIRRVIYAPGASSREIALVEQSRPELLFSGRWRAFALSHRLHVSDHLVFRFKLGALEASVRIFTTAGIHRTYPQPVA
jgi:hypothetical protein